MEGRTSGSHRHIALDLIKGPVLPAAQRIPDQGLHVLLPDSAGGMTLKFECDLGKNDVVKVNYGERTARLRRSGGQPFAVGARLLGGRESDPRHLPQLSADPFAVSSADWQRGSLTNVATVTHDPAVIEREGGSS